MSTIHLNAHPVPFGLNLQEVSALGRSSSHRRIAMADEVSKVSTGNGNLSKGIDLRMFELSLPQCSYSAAFLFLHKWLSSWRDENSDFRCTGVFLFFVVVLPELLFLAASIAVQIIITYFILLEVDKADVCEINVHPVLQWIGVGVFVAEMLQDMFETAMIASWLMKTTTIERDLEDFAPDKMNNLDRILGMAFMVLPKLGIAFWLTGVGSRFVALSKDNAELILNCLAVVFVTKLDELVHATVSSQMVKKLAAKHLKPLKLESGNLFAFDALLGPLFKSVLWVGIVAAVLWTQPQCLHQV